MLVPFVIPPSPTTQAHVSTTPDAVPKVRRVARDVRSGENLLLILFWRRTYRPLFSSATFVTYLHAFSAAYPDQIDLVPQLFFAFSYFFNQISTGPLMIIRPETG